MNEEYEKDIIEDLEANFGDMDLKEDLSKAIISASYNMVVDDIEDYLTDIIKNKSNTMLNDISDDEIKDILIGSENMINSIIKLFYSEVVKC